MICSICKKENDAFYKIGDIHICIACAFHTVSELCDFGLAEDVVYEIEGTGEVVEDGIPDEPSHEEFDWDEEPVGPEMMYCTYKDHEIDVNSDEAHACGICGECEHLVPIGEEVNKNAG